MLTEQGLYVQFVMLLRKDLNITEANKNKNEAKLQLQGQSAISQRWFDIYFYWIEEIFITNEPYFYSKIYQIHDKTQDKNTFKILKFQLEIQNV